MARLKNEIDFIRCTHPGIVQDVETIGKVRCSDYNRMVRPRINLSLKRERNKIVRKKPISVLEIRGKIEEFRISLQNGYSALTEEGDLCVESVKDNRTGIIADCAVEVGGRIVRQDTDKLSHETKDLIKERRSIKAYNRADRIENWQSFQG